MSLSWLILVIIVNVDVLYPELVTWIPNTSFNMPINFKDGKIPCSKETVVFPDSVVSSVRLEAGTSVNGFVLPIEGEISLPAGGDVNFGPETKETSTCRIRDVEYMEKAIAAWNQPNVWGAIRFNNATPDAERLPCFSDTVLFPPETQFTIMLPERTQLVRAIHVDGHSLDRDQFKARALDDTHQLQKFILNQFQDTGIEVATKTCASRAGCVCQRSPLAIDCTVKYCEPPKCIDPVKPIGHCCNICGGVLSFDIDETFELMPFRYLVEKTIEEYGGRKDLEFHIGNLSPNKIQLVVVETNEYDGKSSEAVYAIHDAIEKHWARGSKIAIVSGSPLSRAGLGGELVIWMLFLVVGVLGVVYAWYYHVPILKVRATRGGEGRGRRGRGLLARLQARTDSVVSLTRRDSSADADAPTAFRNPLYDSKRGRVAVTETGYHTEE